MSQRAGEDGGVGGSCCGVGPDSAGPRWPPFCFVHFCCDRDPLRRACHVRRAHGCAGGARAPPLLAGQLTPAPCCALTRGRTSVVGAGISPRANTTTAFGPPRRRVAACSGDSLARGAPTGRRVFARVGRYGKRCDFLLRAGGEGEGPPTSGPRSISRCPAAAVGGVRVHRR